MKVDNKTKAIGCIIVRVCLGLHYSRGLYSTATVVEVFQSNKYQQRLNERYGKCYWLSYYLSIRMAQSDYYMDIVSFVFSQSYQEHA